MPKPSPYPHGADPSIYPTVDVMREAYLKGFYRTYPHEGLMRIGPLPTLPPDADEIARAIYAECRPRCHALIVMPRKILLVRFARRARMEDLARLEYERTLITQTPELAAVSHWRAEMRLVYCDFADGVEAQARARGIRLALYRPRWLYTHRPRNVNRPEHGIVARKLTPERLAQYAAYHDPPRPGSADALNRTLTLSARLRSLTPEQRSARNSKAARTRWARMSAEERRAINRARGERLWGAMNAEQRAELARRLNRARWSKAYARRGADSGAGHAPASNAK